MQVTLAEVREQLYLVQIRKKNHKLPDNERVEQLHAGGSVGFFRNCVLSVILCAASKKKYGTLTME